MNVLVPSKSIDIDLPFSEAYLQLNGATCMFTKLQTKLWSASHLKGCHWYVECPIDKTPILEVSIREKLSSDLHFFDDDELIITEAPMDLPVPQPSAAAPARKSKRKLEKLAKSKNQPTSSQVSTPLSNPVTNNLPVPSQSPTYERAKKLPKLISSPQGSAATTSQSFSIHSIMRKRDFDFVLQELVLNDTLLNFQNTKKSTGVWPENRSKLLAFLEKV